MTQQQQYAALCGWMGVTPHLPLTLDWLYECEAKIGVNAIQQAEYMTILCPQEGDDWELCHASKEQRLEALVRMHGLWKD